MSPVDPGQFSSKLVFDPRWTAVTKLDLDPDVIGDLGRRASSRDVRLLVPIDVQALVVPAGRPRNRWCACRRPSTTRAGRAAASRRRSTAGTPRPARRPPPLGHRPTRCCGAGSRLGTDSNRLALPALPDRWVVLRLLTPIGATQVVVRGLGARGRPGRAGRPGRLAGGERRRPRRRARRSTAADAHRHRRRRGDVGGHLRLGRATASRCTTRSTTSPRSRPTASTVTARPTSSPAGGRTRRSTRSTRPRDQGSLDALLHGLGWSAVTPWVDDADRPTVARRGRPSAVVGRPRVGRSRSSDDPGTEPPADAAHRDGADAADDRPRCSHGLVEGAAAAFFAKPWWPHASLLHGSVYGVPIAPADPGDDGRQPARRRNGARRARQPRRRRDRRARRPALSPRRPTRPGATPSDCSVRSPAQVLRELGSPDGVVEVEEHEHEIGFGSFPGGFRGRGPLPGRVRGRRVAKIGPRRAARRADAQARPRRRRRTCPCRPSTRSLSHALRRPSSADRVRGGARGRERRRAARPIRP